MVARFYVVAVLTGSNVKMVNQAKHGGRGRMRQLGQCSWHSIVESTMPFIFFFFSLNKIDLYIYRCPEIAGAESRVLIMKWSVTVILPSSNMPDYPEESASSASHAVIVVTWHITICFSTCK